MSKSEDDTMAYIVPTASLPNAPMGLEGVRETCELDSSAATHEFEPWRVEKVPTSWFGLIAYCYRRRVILCRTCTKLV